MRLLYFKPELAWPRVSGHDVHCYYMIDALAKLGHAVAFASLRRATPEAVAGLSLAECWGLEPVESGPPVRLTRAQARFASYWGVEPARIRALGTLASEWRADAVVVDGLDVLPYLAGVESSARLWFAADEWVWHHLSQTKIGDPGSWHNLKPAFIKGVYERVYAPLLDRVWVVSENDHRAMRLVTGLDAIDVLPNGVDTDHYRPFDVPQKPKSCVFWGRLDFGPNIQALQWFCDKVWPLLRSTDPDASLTIYGFKPTEPVRRLTALPGVSLIPDLPDIREAVSAHQVAIMPFTSGGGVKSKLLEAFSMSMAIVGTPRACNGLFDPNPPLIRARTSTEWVTAIRALWSDDSRRKALGTSARSWIFAHHTWEAAARTVIPGLEAAAARRADCRL